MTEHRILSKPLLVHLLFRAVAADTGTPHNASQHCTSLLFMRKQIRTAGFSPLRTHAVYCVFFSSVFFRCPVILAFSLVFRGTRHEPRFEKRGIRMWMLRVLIILSVCLTSTFRFKAQDYLNRFQIIQ